MKIVLKSLCSSGASVKRTENGFRLNIPAERHGTYRLAQLYDYASLSRRDFHHTPPWNLNLLAKVSDMNLPGTWGFGLWNDPFGFSLGFGGTAGRLPVLPNAAWFFHASPPNWLSLRNEIPSHGFLTGVIHSPNLPPLLLVPALLPLPLLAIKPISRFLRKLANQLVRQEAQTISVDVTKWHEYSITWLRECVEFKIDGETIHNTSISPAPALGLVIWIDNQFAAWTSEGQLSYGTLDNPAACLEIEVFEYNGSSAQIFTR
jgi:hypothetical protein